MENLKTGTKLFLQYRRAHGWLKPVRLTATGNDLTGILPSDLERITKAFSYDLRVVMVELSFDFDPAFGVDRDYVLKHALFGKSRPAHNHRYPDTLWYGSRNSEKLVRAYFKKQIAAYRVELELHASWLAPPRSHYQFYCLPLGENDFRFVDFNWDALDFYLHSKGSRGRRIGEGARGHYESIHQLLGYLRANGVNNPHTFLLHSKKNNEVQLALDAWCESFRPQRRDPWERRRSLETQNDDYENRVEDQGEQKDEDNADEDHDDDEDED